MDTAYTLHSYNVAVLSAMVLKRISFPYNHLDLINVNMTAMFQETGCTLESRRWIYRPLSTSCCAVKAVDFLLRLKKPEFQSGIEFIIAEGKNTCIFTSFPARPMPALHVTGSAYLVLVTMLCSLPVLFEFSLI